MSAHARLRSFEIFSLFILFLLVSFIIYYTINSAVTADSPLELAGSQLKSAIKPKVILVTGAAGFIGHALSLELIKEHPDNVVIGVDDFNDYYDVRLKMDRAYDLHKHDIVIYNEDICNIDFLEELFSLYNFTNVAHLAAQAGVRYSLKNPQAYIHSNVECQLALMNLLKTQPGIKMIYASSSSIYGKESTIPFRLSAYTDRPGNMYAATKKTDELIAYHYCKSYKLTSVGLRFFTVYGPWGRPDMAVYMFAEAIVEGTSVPMFHVSDDNPLGRDFTYIDDIITGVMAAINYTPGQCGEKYNLGYGNPVSVPKLIEYLQEELGIEADIQKLPLPSTEILRTWADIETSTAILGFRPVIDLKEGVRQFVEWYKNYRIKRHIEENSADTPQRDIWFASIFNERIERHGRYQENYDNKKDDRRRKDVQFERSRFKKWFHTYNVPVPEVKKTSFVLYPDYDSEGGNIIHLSDLKDNMKELQRICEELEDCVAFSTSGHLKHRLQPKSQWLKHTPGVINLYVADIDICSVELDSCSVHSTCTSLGSAQYSCSCHPGYSGDGVQCLPMRGEVSDVELDHIADMYGVYNISAMKSTADMFFFKGVDSPGGDYMLVKDAENRLEELPFICKEDPLCIGITTAGVMKKRIAAQSMWISTGDTSKNHGIYVFDVNYCLLSDHGCPHHSSCARLGPASYQCVCNDNCITSNEACWVKPPISSFLYNDVKDQHGSESGHVAEYMDETLSNENERFHPLLVDIKPL